MTEDGHYPPGRMPSEQRKKVVFFLVALPSVGNHPAGGTEKSPHDFWCPAHFVRGQIPRLVFVIVVAIFFPSLNKPPTIRKCSSKVLYNPERE